MHPRQICSILPVIADGQVSVEVFYVDEEVTCCFLVAISGTKTTNPVKDIPFSNKRNKQILVSFRTLKFSEMYKICKVKEIIFLPN